MSDAQKDQGNIPTPTPEELKQEEQVLKGPTQEEVRSQIIEKYDLNEEEQGELIDKLVTDKVEEQKRLSTAIKQKRTWREKAGESQEKKPVIEKPVVEQKKDEDQLSTKDVVSLANAGIHDDDLQEVLDHAKYKEITVAEVLKTDYIQSFIKDSKEKRKSAEAANTGGSGHSQSKRTDDQILSDAEDKAITPKTDEEWNRLHDARRALKK